MRQSLTCSILVLVSLVTFATAQTPAPDPVERAATAAPKGVSAGLDSALEGGASLRGGRQSGRSLGGIALAHLNWKGRQSEGDTISGFTAYASVLGLAGVGPTEKFAGNFLTASNIEGHESARLYSWWAEAAIGGTTVRAGALLADEEFSTTEVGTHFLNSAFGWPAFVSANTASTGPAFYVPALGLRLRHEFSESAYVQAGVYDGNTFDGLNLADESRDHGLRYRLSDTQGLFTISETGFAVSGIHLKVGAWLHTARFDDVYADSAGRSFALTGADPCSHRRNYGTYAQVETSLYGEPEKPGHVAVHVRTGFAPRDRNVIGVAADAGIAWQGPLATRPADTLALGYAHAAFSSRYSRSQSDANPTDPKTDFESVVELGYTAVLSERYRARPSVEFIRHPGGTTGTRDALLLLVRVEAAY